MILYGGRYLYPHGNNTVLGIQCASRDVRALVSYGKDLPTDGPVGRMRGRAAEGEYRSRLIRVETKSRMQGSARPASRVRQDWDRCIGTRGPRHEGTRTTQICVCFGGGRGWAGVEGVDMARRIEEGRTPRSVPVMRVVAVIPQSITNLHTGLGAVGEGGIIPHTKQRGSTEARRRDHLQVRS